MKYYVGADLGTSSLKLILLREDKTTVKTVTKTYGLSYPHPGWSEQNPSDWWDSFRFGLKELIYGFEEEIAAIAIAGQMHGLVILDENDRVIRPAILWNDGRTNEETDLLNSKIGKESLVRHTANIAFAGFTAPKLMWLWDNERESFDRISKIMLPKDFITYKLTGVHATDFSDASGMLLLDVKNKCWSEYMCDICHITKDQLPRLYESYEPVGTVEESVAKELGLPKSITVAAGAGDNAGAAIGTGTVGDGGCNISLGTSGTVFISSNSFRLPKNNSLHAFCNADGGYHLMGCILSAASANRWFCENILETDDYVKEQSVITDEMLGQGRIFFLPYLMGERCPINDTDATGMFIGLRPDTKRKDMLLSVLEGVAFAIRENFEIAKNTGIDIRQSTVCGGGARSSLWLKVLANVLNVELLLPENEEGPSYGAALLAMRADGKEIDLSEKPKIKTVIHPETEIVERYNEKYRFFKHIYPHVKKLYKELK